MEAEEKEFDCSHQENVVCPYCGYEDEDSWEIGSDTTDIECSECGKKIAIEQQLSRTFSSWKTCQGSADHKWVPICLETHPDWLRCEICSIHKKKEA